MSFFYTLFLCMQRPHIRKTTTISHTLCVERTFDSTSHSQLLDCSKISKASSTSPPLPAPHPHPPIAKQFTHLLCSKHTQHEKKYSGILHHPIVTYKHSTPPSPPEKKPISQSLCRMSFNLN